MSILLGYASCTLAACVILLEFRAVRRLMADTKRMDAAFGPLVTPGRAHERVVEDVQGPLTLTVPAPFESMSDRTSGTLPEG